MTPFPSSKKELFSSDPMFMLSWDGKSCWLLSYREGAGRSDCKEDIAPAKGRRKVIPLALWHSISWLWAKLSRHHHLRASKTGRRALASSCEKRKWKKKNYLYVCLIIFPLLGTVKNPISCSLVFHLLFRFCSLIYYG